MTRLSFFVTLYVSHAPYFFFFKNIIGRKRPWWSNLHLGRSTWHPYKLCFFAAQHHLHWSFIQSINF